MWNCELPTTRPIYLGIVSALERDVAKGVLLPGNRLPGHRELARRLNVTVGTVSKAFAEAERRGLVVSRVGRGSFVRAFPEHVLETARDPRQEIDLSVNTITVERYNHGLNNLFRKLSGRRSLHSLFEHHQVPGCERHRMAAAKWLRLRGIETTADEIVVTSGAQEALIAVLATIARPGVTILTENLNYAGVQRLANLFRLDVRGVEMDGHGMRPDSLAAAGRGLQIGAVLCSPTLHNPTNAVMPLERRRAVLDVAESLNSLVIENDVYGHLAADQTPTMCSMEPGRSIYLSGMSKSIAPGMRIGYVLPTKALFDRVCEGMHATSWTSPGLMGELATLLIEEGLAHDLLLGHQQEAKERLALARDILGDIPIPACASYHIWMPLPSPWRASEFASYVRRRGVAISPSDYFAVGRGQTPHAVRISLGSVRERGELAAALSIVAESLNAQPLAINSAA